VGKYGEWLEENVEIKRDRGNRKATASTYNVFYFIILLLAAVSLILYLR